MFDLPERVVDAVRLPCGHTVQRPDALSATVACPADGRRFELRHKPGRWEARETT